VSKTVATNKESVMSMIHIMVDYKKGLLNLNSALKALDHVTDLGPEICNKMLKSSKRENITQIRAHNNRSKQLLKSEKRKSDQDNI